MKKCADVDFRYDRLLQHSSVENCSVFCGRTGTSRTTLFLDITIYDRARGPLRVQYDHVSLRVTEMSNTTRRAYSNTCFSLHDEVSLSHEIDCMCLPRPYLVQAAFAADVSCRTVKSDRARSNPLKRTTGTNAVSLHKRSSFASLDCYLREAGQNARLGVMGTRAQ